MVIEHTGTMSEKYNAHDWIRIKYFRWGIVEMFEYNTLVWSDV